jgi:hypothetical protein
MAIVTDCPFRAILPHPRRVKGAKTMKIRVSVTVNLSIKQMKLLVEAARTSGYDYDNLNDARKLIRRFLEGELQDAVTYCEERSK